MGGALGRRLTASIASSAFGNCPSLMPVSVCRGVGGRVRVTLELIEWVEGRQYYLCGGVEGVKGPH